MPLSRERQLGDGWQILLQVGADPLPPSPGAASLQEDELEMQLTVAAHAGLLPQPNMNLGTSFLSYAWLVGWGKG